MVSREWRNGVQLKLLLLPFFHSLLPKGRHSGGGAENFGAKGFGEVGAWGFGPRGLLGAWDLGFIEIVKGLPKFCPKVLTESLVAGLGWAGLRWAGRTAGAGLWVGWAAGWAEGGGWAGLCWAGLGWAGLGLGWCGAGLGWARSGGFETEIGLLENGEIVSRPVSRWPTATSNFYLFLS